MKIILEGLAITVIGIIAIWGALMVPDAMVGEIWAGTVPMVIACALTGGGVLLLAQNIKHIIYSGELKLNWMPDTPSLQIMAMVVLAVCYHQGMVYFGYLLPTAIVAPIALWAFGVRHKVGLMIAAILCPAIFYLLFFQLLGVFPPLGEIFDLSDWLRG